MANVLILGGGGREHALAWKLQQSPKVQTIFIAPGNSAPFENVDLDPSDASSISRFCATASIDLVLVGPEAPLSTGVVDKLRSLNHNAKVFGPTQRAAALETSKKYAKKFMVDFGLITARYFEATTQQQADQIIDECNWSGIVVKADGLAAGKGVFVADNKADAKRAAGLILKNGVGGGQLLLEEKLDGYEVSALAFVDGKSFARLPLARDYKRLLNGDRGPNTGGMGVVAPIPVPQDIDTQIDEIFKKTLDGLQRRGIGYTGVLYAGLMIVDDTAYVLEFNCRFGDPETQVLMRLLDEDLYEICISTLQCTLSNTKIKSKQQMACGVVLASSDYPEASDMGTPITQIPSDSDVLQVFHSGTKGHGDHLVTNGGRVLTITAVANSLELARRAANDGAENTKFEGKRFRTDIGMKIDEGLSMTYGASGVSIAEGNAFIEDIKCLVARTLLPGMGQIGGFGALIDLNECGFSNDTQLVVGIDGVGTKLEIASSMGDFSAIGHDVVAMCVNDILCHCAKPIAFLDYFVCGKLDRKMAVQVVASIADACIEAGCSLVGGETAEMPGVYASRQWDVAGCAIGARCKSWPLLPDPSRITEGDIVLGLASNGIHSNGFSLARSILRVNKVTYFHPTPWDAKQSFGKELLKGTKIYVRKILPLLRKGLVKGCAHITGGGLVENVTRVFKKNSELAVSIDCSTWTPPHIFQWLAGNGPISTKEMLRTFNCGIGMVLIVAQSVINEVERQLFAADQDFHRIGTVTKKDTSSSVVFENEANLFNGELYRTSRRKIKVAILISGVGSNMKRLIERAQNADSNCEIVCVISNKSDAAGLHTAARMGIHTIVIPHTEDRVTGEQRMAKCLDEYGAELICLGGYMRILSEQFVQKYRQRIINIHPSLLPAFIGQHALRDALSFGAKVVGCTVHYVDEMVDHGAIIAQRAVPIEESDTYESLQAKIQREEHSVFPEAMITVAERILRSE